MRHFTSFTSNSKHSPALRHLQLLLPGTCPASDIAFSPCRTICTAVLRVPRWILLCWQLRIPQCTFPHSLREPESAARLQSGGRIRQALSEGCSSGGGLTEVVLREEVRAFCHPLEIEGGKGQALVGGPHGQTPTRMCLHTMISCTVGTATRDSCSVLRIFQHFHTKLCKLSDGASVRFPDRQAG